MFVPLSTTCMGCHGIAGYRNAYPSYRVPKLGGQTASYLASALQAYKARQRSHPSMRGVAAAPVAAPQVPEADQRRIFRLLKTLLRVSLFD